MEQGGPDRYGRLLTVSMLPLPTDNGPSHCRQSGPAAHILALTAWFSPALSSLTAWFSPALSSLTAWFSPALSSLTAWFSPALSSLTAWFSPALSSLTAWFSPALSSLNRAPLSCRFALV